MFKDTLKVIGSILAALVVFFFIGWAVVGNNFFMYKFFAPKMEQVRRETYEQTKSYTQGQIQELQNMQFEYIKASPEHQAALASIILHRAADFDEKRLPADLYEFIQKLKREKTGGTK